MPNPKHVRFDNKPSKRTHSDDEDDLSPEQEHKAKKPKVIKEEKDEPKHDGEELSVPAADMAVESNAEADSKWENLVYYYLARLKGLCDWGSEAPENSRITSAGSYKSCNSENLEERVLKNVSTENYPDANKYWAANKKLNRTGQSEVNCYMAAGYKEGKEQGVKIITRALKYGVLSGILAKQGSCYKIHPKYMKKPPSPDSTSNSEISIFSSASSSNSGESVGKDEVKRRAAQGVKHDKFQTEPDPVNIQMKRSFSHIVNTKKPTKHRHNHHRPAPSSDLILRRPSTSKNVQLATRDQANTVSASKKHRGQNIPSRNSSRSLTREVFRSRPQRMSRGRSRVRTPYTAKRTREHGSRAESRGQRRKGRRTKSSSSNKSNY